jgi:UDP-glucose 4-epimerase
MKTQSLVTGGCGFIGSHLVELLLNEGHRVVVLDNMSTGRPSNLDHILDKTNLNIIEGDTQDFKKVKEAMADCEYVFHLAALADIVPSITNPFEYFSANVVGTITLLEIARTMGIKKFIYSASSSCYGIPDLLPTPETSEIRPQYPYAFTKWAGEQAALHWGKVYKIPVISLRLFNVYGPRARTSGAYGAVFGVFLAQKLAGKPLTIVGDGLQTRDFTFVSDVVKAFFAASKSNLDDTVLNVGSNKSFSVNYLAELLGGERTRVPKRPGEPDSTFADTSKIEELLDWKPEVSFERGVELMLENINYWRGAPVWNPKSINEATKEWFSLLGKDNN